MGRLASKAAGFTPGRSTSGRVLITATPAHLDYRSAAAGARSRGAAHRGRVSAGYPRIREIHDGYRAAYRTAHGQEALLDRLAYAALVYVGENAQQARAGAEKVLWYMTSNKVPQHWSNPPGYHPPAIAARSCGHTRRCWRH